MKKLFSLLMLAMLTMSAVAGNYVKVTSTADLTNGNYLIVCEEGAVAFNGALETLDAVGNTIDVTIDNGVIAADATTNAAIFTIDVTAGTVQSASGYYIGQTSDANGLKQSDDATVYTNSFSFDQDGNANIISANGPYLRYNAASNQLRFRYFKSSTYEGQKAVQLYKYEGDPVVTVAAPTFSPAACNFDESITVTLTAEEGATISYSTDGLAWNTYSAPIVLTETTTIYAKAAMNGVESVVVNATYTLNEPVSGDGIVFLPGDFTASANSAFSVTKNGVTIACTSGTVTADQFRFFKNQTVTISSEVGAITKIEFTCTASGTAQYGPGCFTTDAGNYVFDGNVGTWTGSATSVNFVASTNQVRASQVVVYIGGEAPSVVAPVFDPASCVFTGSQVVALSCETDGAAIYYSINDGDYQLYSAPFTLTETATVKAYAELNGTQSSVNSATYTKRAEVMNLAEANALDNLVDFIFNGEAIVTYQNGSNLWVRDATGSGLIYGNQVPEIAQGTVLKDEWTAQRYNYNGVPEFRYPSGVEAGEDVVTVEPFERATLTTDNVNEYIIMKGQTLTLLETDTTGKTWINADSLKFYNQFKLNNLPVVEAGKTYDVVGVVTIYKSNPEVYIISMTEVEDVPTYLRGDVNMDETVSIGDVTALIDYLLTQDATGINLNAADCNLDEGVSIADVTALIDYLLTQSW